jgi:hypothetical protein
MNGRDHLEDLGVDEGYIAIGCKGVSWINLPQNSIQERALGNLVTNFRFCKPREFLVQL